MASHSHFSQAGRGWFYGGINGAPNRIAKQLIRFNWTTKRRPWSELFPATSRKLIPAFVFRFFAARLPTAFQSFFFSFNCVPNTRFFFLVWFLANNSNSKLKLQLQFQFQFPSQLRLAFKTLNKLGSSAEQSKKGPAEALMGNLLQKATLNGPCPKQVGNCNGYYDYNDY